jgi:hypothetical protein
MDDPPTYVPTAQAKTSVESSRGFALGRFDHRRHDQILNR